ncbi:hypothetical protein GCM10007368_09290 [Isoptericola cucumis]|uniref:PKD domain-containing protein n=1 Tax=Isoptericola cucumis TaxID=1776856 RepID=A0ABQ2B4Y8_9MICO|nr:hypothetical protein GCM10007368_09290 [Isoptericola cucumis]
MVMALIATLALAVPNADYDSRANDNDNEYSVEGRGQGWVETASGREPASDEPKDRYARTDAVMCGTLGAEIDAISGIVTAPGACPEGKDVVEITVPCEDDEYELSALWVQRVQDDGTYGESEQLSEDECVSPAELAAQAQRQFRSMKIAAPEATVQGNPPMVVNVHYPAYTSATPQDRTVTLLGVPVVIRAEPTEYTWDFDDPHSAGGSTLTTTSPGRAWHEGDPTPDSSWVGHTYSRLGTPGDDAGTAVDDKGNTYRTGVAASLTTTWQGRFRVQGTSTWTEIPGNVTTTSTTDPTTVTEARTRLVCDDLDAGAVC